MAASVVEICNLALQILGAGRIAELDENSKEAREAKLAYEPLRDSELRAHNWNFARKRAAIPALATPPAFGYANAFQLPVDFLKLTEDNPAQQAAGVTAAFFGGASSRGPRQIEGRTLLSNDVAPYNLVYISRVEDPTSFDACFVMALAARMAWHMCENITQSNTKKDAALVAYRLALLEARRSNAIDNDPSESVEDPWLTARR